MNLECREVARRRASAIQIVRPLESIAEMQPQFYLYQAPLRH
jgi:hypothetical protein